MLYAKALKIQSFDRYRNEWRLMALGDIEQAESVLTASRTISHATTIIRLARLSDSETIHAAELAVSEALEAAVNIIQNKPSVGGIVNITGSNVEYLINDMISKVDGLANSLFILKYVEYCTASTDDEVHRVLMYNLNMYNRYELARLDYELVEKLFNKIKADIDSGHLDEASEMLQMARRHYDAAKRSISAIKPHLDWVNKRPMLYEQESRNGASLKILETQLEIHREIMVVRMKNIQLLGRMEGEPLSLQDIQTLSTIARDNRFSLYFYPEILRKLSVFGHFPYHSWQAERLRTAAAKLSADIDTIKHESFEISSKIDDLLISMQSAYQGNSAGLTPAVANAGHSP